MAIKNVATSAVLGLLFVSLVAIYLLIPTNNLVLSLSVLIMLVSLIVAQSRGWREIGAMAVFAALVSLVAAALVGNELFGSFGRVALPVLWLFALFAMFSWMQRSMLTIPRDRVILITNSYSGGVRQAEGPIAPPLIPGVDRRLAEIPLYNLSTDVRIEKINTSARHNVDAIETHVRYRIKDPKIVLSGIPNRSQAETEIAKGLGKPLREARLDVAYWEKLLDRQMREEVEDCVRAVIFSNVTAQNAIDIYNKREDLAETARARLVEAVQRWGIEVIEFEFDKVEVNPDVSRGINKAKVIEEETALEEIKAKREATRIRLTGSAQAEAEAARVAEMVKAMRASGVELSPDVLREIVIDAIHAATEANLDHNTLRL